MPRPLQQSEKERPDAPGARFASRTAGRTGPARSQRSRLSARGCFGPWPRVMLIEYRRGRCRECTYRQNGLTRRVPDSHLERQGGPGPPDRIKEGKRRAQFFGPWPRVMLIEYRRGRCRECTYRQGGLIPEYRWHDTHDIYRVCTRSASLVAMAQNIRERTAETAAAIGTSIVTPN
jgi:hypothetical protein